MVYAVAVRFVIEPDSQWEADHMAQVVLRSVRDEEGFVELILFGEYETGDYEWIVLWETRQQALEALHAWSEPFMNLLGDYGQWNPPSFYLYQVHTIRRGQQQE